MLAEYYQRAYVISFRVCSICDHKNKSQPTEAEAVIDTDAPRMLRQSIKEPDKFIPTELQLFVEKRRAIVRTSNSGTVKCLVITKSLLCNNIEK